MPRPVWRQASTSFWKRQSAMKARWSRTRKSSPSNPPGSTRRSPRWRSSSSRTRSGSPRVSSRWKRPKRASTSNCSISNRTSNDGPSPEQWGMRPACHRGRLALVDVRGRDAREDSRNGCPTAPAVTRCSYDHHFYPNTTHMNILIADDDLVSRILLKGILRGVPGVQVTEAKDGQETWDLLSAGFTPDLCILDLMMPRMNGMEVLSRIRSCGAMSGMRVALCTANSERQTVMNAAQLRVDAYILKPYQSELVMREVRAAGETALAKISNEDAGKVCERLGISAEAHSECSSTLFGELSQLDALIGDPANRSGALGQVNALRGACANLGFH